jgi:hypothetical protein
MTLAEHLIDIIQLCSVVNSSVYLCLYLNHFPFSLLPYCSKAINTILKKMVPSIIQN